MGEAIGNKGIESGVIHSIIKVYADNSYTTVTVTNGEITLTGYGSPNSTSFMVSPGTWTIMGTTSSGVTSSSITVEVKKNGLTYTATL